MVQDTPTQVGGRSVWLAQLAPIGARKGWEHQVLVEDLQLAPIGARKGWASSACQVVNGSFIKEP